MRNVITIARKEVKTYFSSWIAYAVIAGYLFISGFIFNRILIITAQQDFQFRWVIQNMAVTLIFVLPLLTMRLLAEEKSTGTLEILLTGPVTDWEVVLGKFFGCLGVFLVTVVLSFLFPLIVIHYGKPDLGPMFTSYIGFMLVGAAFIAVGVFGSSLTDSQVVAGFLSFGMLLILWIIDWGSSQASSKVGAVLEYLSVLKHLEDFVTGILSTTHVVYYLSFVWLFLFFSVRVLESRKWR